MRTLKKKIDKQEGCSYIQGITAFLCSSGEHKLKILSLKVSVYKDKVQALVLWTNKVQE